MHQNEELLEIDCPMEKEERNFALRGFLCLLHFKVTKVGNWLGAGKSSTKTCWKRTNGFQNHFPPSFAIHCVLERFSFVDVVKVLVCILQYTVGLYLQSSRMY